MTLDTMRECTVDTVQALVERVRKLFPVAHVRDEPEDWGAEWALTFDFPARPKVEPLVVVIQKWAVADRPDQYCDDVARGLLEHWYDASRVTR